MTDVWVGLGSNLGDRAVQLRSALRDLDRTAGFRLRSVSSFRPTAPEGGPLQPDYLNAVARLECACAPRPTLQRLLEIEARRGRVRSVPNGPRTLDLDLLFFGEAVLEGADLVLPHPRVADRRFVLEPLAEIAPRLVLPGGRRAAERLRELDQAS